MKRTWSDDRLVTCIACGVRISRSDAREYDRFGDRWDRANKEFEYLCKRCFADECHFPRDDLESILMTLDGDSTSVAGFVRAYYRAVANHEDNPNP